VYHELPLCYNNSRVYFWTRMNLRHGSKSCRPLINLLENDMNANISITDMVEEFNLPQITIKKKDVGVLWSQLQTLREGYSCIADVPKSTAIEYGLNTG